jgi:FdhD protein
MPDARRVPVAGLRGGQLFQGEDWVAEERPVALVYNGISHAVMLATPNDLEDFALGFSLSEGIVDNPSQIYGIEVQPDVSCDGQLGITVALDIASSCFARLKERRRTLAGRTGCGLCGTDSLEQAVRMPQALRTDVVFQPAAVSAALGHMRERQRLLGSRAISPSGVHQAAATTRWTSWSAPWRVMAPSPARRRTSGRMRGSSSSAAAPVMRWCRKRPVPVCPCSRPCRA